MDVEVDYENPTEKEIAVVAKLKMEVYDEKTHELMKRFWYLVGTAKISRIHKDKYKRQSETL